MDCNDVSPVSCFIARPRKMPSEEAQHLLANLALACIPRFTNLLPPQAHCINDGTPLGESNGICSSEPRQHPTAKAPIDENGGRLHRGRVTLHHEATWRRPRRFCIPDEVVLEFFRAARGGASDNQALVVHLRVMSVNHNAAVEATVPAVSISDFRPMRLGN
jgi:hypothetical protein